MQRDGIYDFVKPVEVNCQRVFHQIASYFHLAMGIFTKGHNLCAILCRWSTASSQNIASVTRWSLLFTSLSTGFKVLIDWFMYLEAFSEKHNSAHYNSRTTAQKIWAAVQIYTNFTVQKWRASFVIITNPNCSSVFISLTHKQVFIRKLWIKTEV